MFERVGIIEERAVIKELIEKDIEQIVSEVKDSTQLVTLFLTLYFDLNNLDSMVFSIRFNNPFKFREVDDEFMDAVDHIAEVYHGKLNDTIDHKLKQIGLAASSSSFEKMKSIVESVVCEALGKEFQDQFSSAVKKYQELVEDDQPLPVVSESKKDEEWELSPEADDLDEDDEKEYEKLLVKIDTELELKNVNSDKSKSVESFPESSSLSLSLNEIKKKLFPVDAYLALLSLTFASQDSINELAIPFVSTFLCGREEIKPTRKDKLVDNGLRKMTQSHSSILARISEPKDYLERMKHLIARGYQFTSEVMHVLEKDKLELACSPDISVVDKHHKQESELRDSLRSTPIIDDADTPLQEIDRSIKRFVSN